MAKTIRIEDKKNRQIQGNGYDEDGQKDLTHPIVCSIILGAVNNNFFGTWLGIRQSQEDGIVVMDLEILFGRRLRVLDIPKKAGVDVGLILGEAHSDILALGYTVLGGSNSPFVFGTDIAERLVLAGLRCRPRF